MKIALIGDMHLGYRRFESDAKNQAKAALENANKKADLIILAGDIFDVKIPRMETIESAIEILKNIEKPVLAIHGNHDRRSKDKTNPVELLRSGGFLHYLHNKTYEFEKDSLKVNILGVGNIPSGYVKQGIESSIEKNPPKKGFFNILVIHQNINELIVGEQELSIEEIEDLPYNLIVNGHIHKKYLKLNKKLILPGSTVVTQLKAGEQESRGYVLYDVSKKEFEFVEISCRKFKIVKLDFLKAGLDEVEKRILDEIEKTPEGEIRRIILGGTLKDGLKSSDLKLPQKEYIFIDNKLNDESLKERIERIKKLKDEKLSIREYAVKEISDKVKDKVSFDPVELFNKLQNSVDEAEEYLEED